VCISKISGNQIFQPIRSAQQHSILLLLLQLPTAFCSVNSIIFATASKQQEQLKQQLFYSINWNCSFSTAAAGTTVSRQQQQHQLEQQLFDSDHSISVSLATTSRQQHPLKQKLLTRSS
jgi:hypothetical protein